MVGWENSRRRLSKERRTVLVIVKVVAVDERR